MIAFGLRLTLRGGRESAVRLALIAAATAIGVSLLLTTLAGINAVNAQNARYAWLQTTTSQDRTGRDAAWWLLSADWFHARIIGRLDVAATGPDAPVPPGIPRLPAPGTYYASPAMSALLATTPREQLGARYAGEQVGTIGAAGLPAPDSLVIVVGHAPEQLAHVPGAERVTALATTTPSSCNGPHCDVGIDANGIDLVLSVVAGALLFPVLIFIGVATRLSAARREQRLAAMRLVGATPGQVRLISAVESTVAAGIGVAVGFAAFAALRLVLAPIPFTGAPFYLHDLSLSVLDVVLVALGVPLGAAVAATIALRRVTMSPLGVYRRVTPSAPRAWRLLPLLAGLGELAYFVLAGNPATTAGQVCGYLTGMLLTLAGLVIAGPWLTMLGSRLLARRATGPAALIAARRLADSPQAGFRAISGLVLALFVTSASVGIITTIAAEQGGAGDTKAQHATLVNDFYRDNPGGQPTNTVASVPAVLLGQLRALRGVNAVVLIHSRPVAGQVFTDLLLSCAELARSPALGRCPASAQAVTIDLGAVGSRFAPSVWPATTLPAGGFDGLPVQNLVVVTDGSASAIERARTAVEGAYPYATAPQTITEQHATRTKNTTAYERLADVVILASLAVAGCTLAVSVVTGLNERRRSFSLLRLAGAPLAVLRRVVLLESAMPLLLAAAVSLGTGFLAAALFLRSQLSETLQWPGPAFYAVVVLGLAASLGVIASTLPLLGRIASPESARTD